MPTFCPNFWVLVFSVRIWGARRRFYCHIRAAVLAVRVVLAEVVRRAICHLQSWAPQGFVHPDTKSLSSFFFLIWHKCISEERLIAVLCPWLSSLCWGKSHSWESSWPSLQKSSFNSLQLQNILLEDLFKPFGGWVTHWQTTDGELSSYRKPSEFCKKAKISLFPPCFCGVQ